MLKTESILQNSKSDRFITVEGKRFHYIWLRDHCLCPCCRESNSLQRVYDMSEHQEVSPPLSVDIRDEKLIIEWDEEPSHRSIFSISWLMNRAYDREPVQQSQSETILWDKAWLDANLPKWQTTDSYASELWGEKLSKLGFTILRNIDFEDLKSLVSSIGPVYPFADFDLYTTLKPTPKSEKIEDLGVSPYGHAVPPHTDMSFIDKPPLVLFLYSMENEASGGESILVDGFRVAKDFQQKYPDYFRILARTPVDFQVFIDRCQDLFSHRSTVLKVNEKDEVIGLNCSYKNLVVNLPFEQTEKFYEAFICFFDYLQDPTYQYCFRLERGDCIVAQNFRVLHGRKAFDSSSGSRDFKISYLPWDYFRARHNFTQFRYKLYINDNY